MKIRTDTNRKNFHEIISLDEEFMKMIEEFSSVNERQIGRVHSIFKKVINFEVGSKGMYTLQTKALDNAPYSARIDGRWAGDFTESNICVFDPVRIGCNTLKIGDCLALKLDKQPLWKPENLNIYPDKKTISIFNEKLKEFNDILLSKGSNGGGKYYYVKNHIETEQLHKPSLIEKELAKRICNLQWSIENKCKFLKENINSVIGLGNGLTPSGDDILAGLISALNFVRSEKAGFAGGNIKSALKKSELSTTDISIAMLRASMEEKHRENIIDFIWSLCTKERALSESLDKMFAIGSSSGTDLSIGIVMGLIHSLNTLENGGI